MSEFVREIPYAILTTAAILLGLWWSNFFYDKGIPHWQSRKVGHFFGGVGFLLLVFLFKSLVWPLILVVGFVLLLTIARILRPSTFRGVGGTGRSTEAWSEVYFAASSLPVILLGWGLWHKPIESVACVLMMCWGDCVTGWIRSLRYTKPTKGIEGSIIMFLTCALIAWAFLQPVWLGMVVALCATIVEFISGDVSPVKWLRWTDDNWVIPVISAIVYFGGLYVIGML